MKRTLDINTSKRWGSTIGLARCGVWLPIFGIWDEKRDAKFTSWGTQIRAGHPHFVIRNFPSAFFIRNLTSAFYRPHFIIRILSSAFCHPHFIIRIFPPAFFHPHFIIRNLTSAFLSSPFYHPHIIICIFFSFRRHPVLTLQKTRGRSYRSWFILVTTHPALL